MTVNADNVVVSLSGGTPDQSAIINQFLQVAQTLPQGGLGQAMRLGAGITAQAEALAEAAPDGAAPDVEVVAQVVADAAVAAQG